MGTSDALTGLPAEEVGIGIAEHEAAGVLIDGVTGIDIAQIGHRQERGHVGIVHQVMIAESVALVGIDLAVLGMIVDGVLPESRLHLVGQGPAVGGQLRVVVHLGQDVGSLAQGGDSKEVGRHEEEEHRGIVAGTEGRGDESTGAHRVTVAVMAHGVILYGCGALEAIGSVSVLTLLLAEGLQHGLDGIDPQVGLEDGVVARHEPVLISQADGIAKGVDLILTLMQEGLHVGEVRSPLAACRPHVEGVAIGVEYDALQLSQDGATHHVAHLLVVLGKLYVGPHLGS